MDIQRLKAQLRRFAHERNWEQFHSPKNLSMALAVEASELLEQFQWLTEDDSQALRARPDDYAAVVDEMADVMIYLVRLADRLEVDLEAAVADKIRKNEAKYPVDLAYGTAVKYNRREPTHAGAPNQPPYPATSDD
jgi:NTP pyrophosphatase (non-canonical NTP hydrolase)